MEQTAALQRCLDAVNKLLNPICTAVKFPCLVGRAGSGKSYVLKLATAYALSKCLHVELMSWTSERSRQLGGNHLHNVFPLEVSSSRIIFANSIAAKCLSNLQNDSMRTAMIKGTDICVFEEIVQLSAEYFEELDTVLRVVMGNSSPWGGKLPLCCSDSKQLPPIDGRPIWCSINMCTMMEVFVFAGNVRARDPNLLWVNSECRRQLTTAEARAVADVICSECQFVEDWSNVPDVAVRIVSTKQAEIKVMEEFLRGRATVSLVAVDEVQNGSIWQPARERVTKALNKNLYEYDVCQLFVPAMVRMTYNERRGACPFSQGQIAVVVGLPDAEADYFEQRLRLRLAPPGMRNINTACIPADWPEVVVRRRTTPLTIVGSHLQMARRTQFPVRYYLSITIHRIQGDTVPVLATEISVRKREYRMWQKEQFAVLISRVQYCRDFVFVGSTDDTREAIEHILTMTTPWTDLIDHYLSELNVAERRAQARSISIDSHLFLPLYRELPAAACGYVYMLVSLKTGNSFYVGETTDLKKSLRQHNTGYGTEMSRNTNRHSWGVFAFVVGFERDPAQEGDAMRNEFAQTWTNLITSRMNADDVYERGRRLANEWTELEIPLTIVKCGHVFTARN